MTQYLQYFFNPAHLFSAVPPAMSPRAVLILLVVFGGFIAVAIASQVMAKKMKDGIKIKAYRQVSNLGYTIGIIGLAYVFFAWQSVAFLSSRIILIVLAVIAITWAAFILRFLKKKAPQMRKEIEQKRAFERYMP